jgi:hypothetical protein
MTKKVKKNADHKYYLAPLFNNPDSNYSHAPLFRSDIGNGRSEKGEHSLYSWHHDELHGDLAHHDNLLPHDGFVHHDRLEHMLITWLTK